MEDRRKAWETARGESLGAGTQQRVRLPARKLNITRSTKTAAVGGAPGSERGGVKHYMGRAAGPRRCCCAWALRCTSLLVSHAAGSAPRAVLRAEATPKPPAAAQRSLHSRSAVHLLLPAGCAAGLLPPCPRPSLLAAIVVLRLVLHKRVNGEWPGAGWVKVGEVGLDGLQRSTCMGCVSSRPRAWQSGLPRGARGTPSAPAGLLAGSKKGVPACCWRCCGHRPLRAVGRVPPPPTRWNSNSCAQVSLLMARFWCVIRKSHLEGGRGSAAVGGEREGGRPCCPTTAATTIAPLRAPPPSVRRPPTRAPRQSTPAPGQRTHHSSSRGQARSSLNSSFHMPHAVSSCKHLCAFCGRPPAGAGGGRGSMAQERGRAERPTRCRRMGSMCAQAAVGSMGG
jgi:hypothetical protein